ncbi:hypothetical protein Mal4_21030 [Maioricimonas rarisocia]|uniref:Uncharacterized protein n=1 Tax=Maioricimonas rarisocia TaxID=2528026 RepID=A0A517Z5N2_9PLAN|nr:hypothetical protein [Maioricimonas rarisocia]QDU37786.1 hypothetical protein Mal4_21030 [Maioricimonas rarisocia]
MGLDLRDVAEFSAVCAVHGSHVVAAGQPVGDAWLERYLDACSRRARMWHQAHQECTQTSDAAPVDAAPRHMPIVHLADEILVTEVLTRTWTGVMAELARKASQPDVESAAWHGYMLHLKAKQTVLADLLYQTVLPVGVMLRVNRLRRRLEKWSDMFVSQVAGEHVARELAFETHRVDEFRDEQVTWRTGHRSKELLVASVRQAVPADTRVVPERAEVHRELMSLQVALFPADAFSGTGLLKSPHQAAIERGSRMNDRLDDAAVSRRARRF